MKKALIYSLLATTIMFSTSVIATAKPCAMHDKSVQNDKISKHTTHYSPCRFMPEEHKKIIEAKKEEFKKRLNITEEQRAELEKIKAHEQKVLIPYKKKIEKEEEKLKDLFLKEHEIRVQHSQQFEAILTPEQKIELQKFKSETIKEMMKFAPPTEMFNKEEKATSITQNNENNTNQQELLNNPKTKPELKCTCKEQNEAKEDNVKSRSNDAQEINAQKDEAKELNIKGTSEDVLKDASTENFDTNEKNISKFMKENVANEEVESVAPNEELQPKSLERKIIEPTIAPTPSTQTNQDEITLEK